MGCSKSGFHLGEIEIACPPVPEADLNALVVRDDTDVARAGRGGGVGHGAGFGKKRAPNDLKPSAGWSRLSWKKRLA
jgi:hypothetical protein